MYIVHINKSVIQRNVNTGGNDPPVIVRNGRYGKTTRYCHEAKLTNARIVHSPQDPLPCGARVWIEADDVEIIR